MKDAAKWRKKLAEAMNLTYRIESSLPNAYWHVANITDGNLTYRIERLYAFPALVIAAAAAAESNL